MKPRKIGIFCKKTGKEPIETVKQIQHYLDKKANLYFESRLAKRINSKKILNPKQADLLLAVGGDGTLLKAVRLSAGTKIPSVGIVRGGMGFLMEIDANLEQDLDRLLKGDFFVEERIKLNIKVNGKSVGEALNDAVITTAQPAKIQRFQIDIHGDKIDNIAADGIVISTPTGSTAYAMSAGGPILDPILDAYELVPICPFRLSSRAITVPASTKTTIKITTNRKAVLAVDGKDIMKLDKNDKIEIVKAKNLAYLVKFEKNFFQKVRVKLV